MNRHNELAGSYLRIGEYNLEFLEKRRTRLKEVVNETNKEIELVEEMLSFYQNHPELIDYRG